MSDAARVDAARVRRVLLVFAVCAFASGFGLRTIDPLILPVGAQFAVSPAAAAGLSTAYALPYALAQPFLGPLGDRYGKLRCIQVCVSGMALSLVAGALAPNFAALLASRVVAGIFAGGLIPLVLAGLGDAFDILERQVAIGRMLLAIITGQMLGSTVSGLASDAFGWRSALWIAAGPALAATALAWWPQRRVPAVGAAAAAGAARQGMAALYAQVFRNPKAPWLYGAVVVEGALIFGAFPFVGQMLVERHAAPAAEVAARAGLVLGAFGVGGLVYAAMVRRILGALGVRRMCLVGSATAAAMYLLLGLSPWWGLHALAMGVAGLAYYMLHNSLQTEATEIAPVARGSAVALFACGFFAGQGLGPLLFGALAAKWGYLAALLAMAAGLVLLGQLVVRRVTTRPRA
ncbi:MAG: MFS transporter [Burkholderiaceae bacterium]